MFERISLYFGFVMIFIYLGAGIFLLYPNSISLGYFPNTAMRIGIGSGVIAYAFFRAYMAKRKYDEMQDDGTE